jgi:Protein of unknown function (DUF2510)
LTSGRALIFNVRRDVMAMAGWYPPGDGSSGLRWWDGTSWTDSVAAPGSVLDRAAYEAGHTWGDAWYSLTDRSGASLGDAYEVQTGQQRMVPAPMVNGRWVEPAAAAASLEAVVRDTRQAHLLSVVRAGAEQSVTVYGPDRTVLGTISRSSDGIDVSVGQAAAYRIAPSGGAGRSDGATRFSVRRADGAEAGGMTLRYGMDRAPGPGTRPGLRFVLDVEMIEAQPPPASALIGALPMGLAMLMLPAQGMDLSASLPNGSDLRGRALGGLASALLDGLADTDF